MYFIGPIRAESVNLLFIPFFPDLGGLEEPIIIFEKFRVEIKNSSGVTMRKISVGISSFNVDFNLNFRSKI